MLCELQSFNVCDLNVIYLYFVEFCIKFGIFYIAGHEPVRRTIGPRAFRAGLARKLAHVSCLGR